MNSILFLSEIERLEKSDDLITCVDLLGDYKKLNDDNKRLLNRFLYNTARIVDNTKYWIFVEETPISYIIGKQSIEQYRGEVWLFEIKNGKLCEILFHR